MRNKKRFYRRFNVDLPKETVERIVAEYAGDPEKYSHTPLAGPYTPPDVDELVGKCLAFRGKEKDLDFRFTGLNEVWFREEGEEKRCFCNVKTLDHEIYFVNFLVPGYATSRQITLVADLKNGLATAVDARIGTEYTNNDVDRDFWFGRLEGLWQGAEEHGFTTELLGKSIIWDYGPKIIKIKHIYNCDIYYTYKNLTANGTWMATNPADYVKIRDGVYIFSFVEERQGGIQAVFLIDTARMHDIGCFYGVSADHLTSACLGAVGEFADPNTIA